MPNLNVSKDNNYDQLVSNELDLTDQTNENQDNSNNVDIESLFQNAPERFKHLKETLSNEHSINDVLDIFNQHINRLLPRYEFKIDSVEKLQANSQYIKQALQNERYNMRFECFEFTCAIVGMLSGSITGAVLGAVLGGGPTPLAIASASIGFLVGAACGTIIGALGGLVVQIEDKDDSYLDRLKTRIAEKNYSIYPEMHFMSDNFDSITSLIVNMSDRLQPDQTGQHNDYEAKNIELEDQTMNQTMNLSTSD